MFSFKKWQIGSNSQLFPIRDGEFTSAPFWCSPLHVREFKAGTHPKWLQSGRCGEPRWRFPLPERSPGLRWPGPPLPPAGPPRSSPHRTAPPRFGGSGFAGSRVVRRALPGRRGLQRPVCRLPGPVLSASSHCQKTPRKVTAGVGAFLSLQDALHSVLQCGEFLGYKYAVVRFSFCPLCFSCWLFFSLCSWS